MLCLKVCKTYIFPILFSKHQMLCKIFTPDMIRTFSGLCGLGVLAGATMVPVTTSLRGKRLSEDSLNNNHAQAVPLRKPNRVLRMFLGHELAASKRLNHYLLFVFTDFLCFTSVYIPYTHLPNFAEVPYLRNIAIK